jgi:hypothetical protein
MRPSASSGPREDVASPQADNDRAEDEVASGLKPRGRATSMIRRTNAVQDAGMPLRPSPGPIPAGRGAADSAPPSTLASREATEPPASAPVAAAPDALEPDEPPVTTLPPVTLEPATLAAEARAAVDTVGETSDAAVRSDASAGTEAPAEAVGAAQTQASAETAGGAAETDAHAEATGGAAETDAHAEAAAGVPSPTPADAAPATQRSTESIPSPTPSAAHRSLLADPTQRPPDAAPSSSSRPTVLTPAKPLLASEALMEDLAPVEPARRDARVWCGACGVAFLFFGLLPLLGLLPGALAAALPWLVTGAIALVAGAASVSYRQRAVAMLVLGALTGFVALQGSETLVRADGGPGWGLARLCAVVALTAALLFRARYRAYAGARVFLGTALVISLPFIVHAVHVLLAESGFGPAHIGVIVVLLAIAATLTGFMGAETIGAGPYVARTLVVAFALELASRGVAVVGLEAGLSPLLGVLIGAAGFGAAAGFTAIGLFQILASRFAADARRIDLHSAPRETAPSSEHDPSSEWGTRQ